MHRVLLLSALTGFGCVRPNSPSIELDAGPFDSGAPADVDAGMCERFCPPARWAAPEPIRLTLVDGWRGPSITGTARIAEDGALFANVVSRDGGTSGYGLVDERAWQVGAPSLGLVRFLKRGQLVECALGGPCRSLLRDGGTDLLYPLVDFSDGANDWVLGRGERGSFVVLAPDGGRAEWPTILGGAERINALGLAAGQAPFAGSAAYWLDGRALLVPDAGLGSWANALNDEGLMVGRVLRDGIGRGALFWDSDVVEISCGLGQASELWAVNNHRIAVGQCGTEPSARAVIWARGSLVPLGDVVDGGQLADCRFVAATDINEADQVAVVAECSGVRTAVRLTFRLD